MLVKANSMSAKRETTRSAQPPKYPATIPSGTPMSSPIATASTPMSNEIRVPYMSRVAMSRPSWSVPSQCDPEGPWIATDRS